MFELKTGLQRIFTVNAFDVLLIKSLFIKVLAS